MIWKAKQKGGKDRQKEGKNEMQLRKWKAKKKEVKNKSRKKCKDSKRKKIQDPIKQ